MYKEKLYKKFICELLDDVDMEVLYFVYSFLAKMASKETTDETEGGCNA